MRTWKSPALAALLALAGTLVLVTGCAKDGNEYQRLVCEVIQVNDGNPLMSAYVIPGNGPTTPDKYPIDSVPVTFGARPYDASVVLPPDTPYSSFHVTSYDLNWRPLSAEGDSLVNYNIRGAAAEALVPVNDKASTSILIADRHLKDQPWFAELSTGARASFTAVADIRFHGHESGSTRDVVVPAALTVTFVGAAVQ